MFTRRRCKDRYTRLRDNQHPATRLPQCHRRAELCDKFLFIQSSPGPSIRGDVPCLTFFDNWRGSQAAQSEINPWSFSLWWSPVLQMGEVRKLQKKLRQIENLEIKISLTPEERFKVQKHLICLLYFSCELLCEFGKSSIDFPQV